MCLYKVKECLCYTPGIHLHICKPVRFAWNFSSSFYVWVHFSTTVRARLMILGQHLLLDEIIWNQPSISDSDVYFTVHWLTYTNVQFLPLSPFLCNYKGKADDTWPTITPLRWDYLKPTIHIWQWPTFYDSVNLGSVYAFRSITQ